MIYQHSLACLLGLEGVALLHAFAGDYERDFTEVRLAVIQTLPDSAGQLCGRAAIQPISVVEVIAPIAAAARPAAPHRPGCGGSSAALLSRR
jgi:hypothetical protein